MKVHQVYVRQHQQHGDVNRMLLAEVVSHKGDVMVVKANGGKPMTVSASKDVVPVATVHGGQARLASARVTPGIQSQLPGMHTLGAMFRK